MSPTYIHILQSLILLQTLTHISSTTSVLLTPQNPSQNGASVELIQQSDWDLYATDETAINMKIHLDKSWSFNSQHITTLNLQINSNNLPHTSNTSLIVSFSQNNTKYITSVIETGATTSNSIYSPQYDGKQPYGQGNIEQLLSTSNILDSNDTHGYIPYILSPNFPLTFTLQNHPNFDFMIFTYSYPSAAPKHIIYYGMDTTKPLDIYFSICDMSDNFDITSFNITHSTVTTSLIPHFNTTFYTEQDIKSTQEISKYENISSIDWVKTSLVIILVSTIGILCCLCCLFGIMFTTIINNHKKIILSKHTETTNQHTSDTTTQMETKTSVNVCKSDTNENQTNDHNTVPKTIVITDTIMTMTPPTMANILGDSISKSNIQIIINDDINHHDSIGCNINDDINIVYKEFTRDRLYMDGEVDIKEEKEIIYEMDTKEEKKETDDDIEDMYININNNGTPSGTDIDDMEDMYINNNINNNITPRGNNINNNINNNITPRGIGNGNDIISQGSTRDILDFDGEEDKKQTDSDSSEELQDMFSIPIRQDLDRIRMVSGLSVSQCVSTDCYASGHVSGLSGSTQCVVNENLMLNIKDITSGVSAAEGTTSPYGPPTLQYVSPTVNSSIAPYAINDYQITI